jgi:hypothetical protein
MKTNAILCSRCSAAMTCNPEGGCWCASFPPVLSVPSSPNEGCLCPKCLRDSIALSGQADNFETLPEGK